MNLPYLTDVVILLAAAVIAVPVTRRMRLGTVPGFLVAGVLVGPSVSGLIDNREEITHLAELGVVLLLFVIGIELKPSRLWLMRRMVFGLGTLQVVTTGVLISAAAYYAFGVDLRAAILIGPALALSSTAFVLQLLTEQGTLASSYGRTTIAVLLLQDLAVVPLLALASMLTVSELSIEADIGIALLEAASILTLIILGGRFLLQPILHRVASYGSPEIFTASVILLVLGFAVLMAQMGLSMAMGAFVAGLLVADSEYRHQVMAEIQPFRGLLLGLFFISMGMSLDLKEFLKAPLVSLSVVGILMLTKATLIWLLARFFRHGNNIALAIALLLAQSGEFGLVLFSVGFGNGILSESLFQQLLVIVVLSMLLTPPLAALAYRLASSRRQEPFDAEDAVPEPSPPGVLIVGFGRVGHRVGQILEMRDIPYVAVDNDASVVKRKRAMGRPVYYGDARQPDVLKSLGVGDASIVIVTVDSAQVAENVVSLVSRMFPKLDILARGHDLERIQSLQALGARLSVSENLEASLALAREALNKVTGDDARNDQVIERFRYAYYLEARAKAPDREPPP